MRAQGIRHPILIIGVIGYAFLLCLALLWLHVSPVMILGLTAGGAATLLIGLQPYIGVQALVMLLFLEGAVSTVEGVTGMKVLGVVILLAWIGNLAMRRSASSRFDLFAVALLGFLGWGSITVIYANDGALATTRMLTFAQLGLVAMMFSSVVDSPKRLRGVYAAYVVWALVSTLIAIGGYYLGFSAVASGLVGNRNLLALYVNVAIVCAYLLHQTTESRVVRTAIALAIPVFFLGLALSFSRTGLIVQGVALLAVWYRVARQKGFLILGGSLAALALITVLLPTAFWQRAGSIVPVIERQQDTFGLRVRLWKAGMKMIQDHPVTGVGPGNFVITARRYAQGEMRAFQLSAHNTYVSVAAETGIVGLAAFLLLAVLALRDSRKAIHAARAAGRRDLETYAIISEVCLLVVMATGVTMTVEGLKIFWFLLGLSLAARRVVMAAETSTSAAVGSTGVAPLPPDERAWGLATSDTR